MAVPLAVLVDVGVTTLGALAGISVTERAWALLHGFTGGVGGWVRTQSRVFVADVVLPLGLLGGAVYLTVRPPSDDMGRLAAPGSPRDLLRPH